MGCKHSTTIKVQPVGASAIKRDNTGAAVGKEGSTQTPTLSRKGLSRESTAEEYELDAQGNKVRRKTAKGRKKQSSRTGSRNNLGSSLSLDDERSLDGDRGFSATSKASADSGLGGDDCAYGQGLGNIITEYSNANDVQMVERSFVERDDLDLGITGVQLPTRLSAKDRTRQEESSILQSLREEGLIAKPTTQAAGGMSFEIVTKESFDSTGLPCPPPRQLEKLERRRKKKKTLTEEEIREKLERAEKRRKKREEERLNKIKEMERTDALAALENFETYKKEKVVQHVQKMDVVTDNRDKKLKELQEKLKERERRAAEVRRRKQEALEKGLASSGIINNDQEYPEGVENPAFSHE